MAVAALTLPPITASINLVTLVLRGLDRMEGLQEIGGDNMGRAVKRILERAGGKEGEPWCAALVFDAGEGMLGKQWPLPRTRSCDVLLEFARKHKLLHETPEPGDVGLLMRSEWDAIHTFFVTELGAAGAFRTIEGNTNDDGSANGYAILRRVRGDKYDKALKRGLYYRFIRWHAPVGVTQ